ncbi:hypothetical protein [Bacillus phage SDFMU_Pbc]|uniref:Polymer-forming cytoskeletal protein n=1 Tax=Bacillus phage SDFMU_Pbc TaxID=3076135 RepID=A0AA96KS51_9CAUD|nr:hypothetical protein [Bacillus phage SDFMU_Pbc]
MDSNYFVVLIIYSVTALIMHEVADRRYNRLESAGVVTYSATGRFMLGITILLFPALTGASYLGLVMAHLTTVTEAGFVIALIIFSTSLAAGGFLTFTALCSAEEDNKEGELTMENAEQQKYILLGEDTLIAPNGSTLYRIEAVRDFSNVFRGDLGGYIQHEGNLSHAGDCWVYDNARVYDDAQVLGNARVHGNVRVRDAAVVDENAIVHDNAKILGYAVVTGSAHVSRNAVVSGSANVRDFSTVRGSARIQGKAKIEDHAIISGDAEVRGDASIRLSARVFGNATIEDGASLRRTSDVFVIHPIGNENGTLTAYLDRDGEVRCTRGCFNGTLEQFSEAVEKTHKYLNPSVFAEYQLVIKLIEKKFFDYEELELDQDKF